MIKREITGVRAFDELYIDQGMWREAHGHHHKHRRLHAVASHRPGIVFGLEVVESGANPQQVIVAPGVAIDSEGQTIIIKDKVELTFNDSGYFYIILSFLSTVDPGSTVTVSSGGVEYYREVEGRKLEPTKTLPQTPFLELARINRSATNAPVKNAANPLDPGKDQINLMFRSYAFPHCYGDIGVGELGYVGLKNPDAWRPNRTGLWNLLHEGNGRGFHLTFTNPFTAAARSAGGLRPGMLYMAGRQGFQPLADNMITALRRFLSDEGGVLFGEAVGGSTEFRDCFQNLASQLGAGLDTVGKGSPLLTSHYMFAAAPPGGRTGTLLGDLNAGVFLSTLDYGAAWQGDLERPEAADSRERIRQSVEFGLNIVAFAARRQREVYLNTLSGT
jgi:hypothetical protein